MKQSAFNCDDDNVPLLNGDCLVPEGGSDLVAVEQHAVRAVVDLGILVS